MSSKIIKRTLIVIGILLILNGLINISDDGMILAYDITSILSGLGFILVISLSDLGGTK
jgi:ABC-type transport system involved in multi-copper enzyme maturation permease subunit